jgi:arylsulfatase
MTAVSGFGHLETTEFMLSKLDEFGSPTAHNHYAVGWSHALDTPYQWTKQVASHFGGTRNGLVVHWPKGIQSSDEVRSQFHHVIDIAPTILEAAGIPEPSMVHSVQQKPMEGVSMAYTFDDAQSPDRHETQYFEMIGNRGIYHKGWTAVTRHRTPWETIGTSNLPDFDDDNWELYDTNVDWTQAHDLTKEYPEKLHELQRLWLIEAVRYNVLPLDDRFAERALPDIAGRPTTISGDHQFFFGGMDRINEQVTLPTTNRSHSVTAGIVVPESGAEGVIMAVGNHAAGWSLYTKEGKLKYCYNFYGIEHTYIEGSTTIPSGTHQVRMAFDYDGGGMAKGATVSLYLDGDKIGEGRLEQPVSLMFAVNNTCDIGHQRGSLVTHEYGRDNAFSGNVNWVQLAIEDVEDAEAYISREQLIKAYLAMQ